MLSWHKTAMPDEVKFFSSLHENELKAKRSAANKMNDGFCFFVQELKDKSPTNKNNTLNENLSVDAFMGRVHDVRI
jgi:hypothetical protein